MNRAALLIVISLLFAGGILVSSALIDDPNTQTTVSNLLIAIWFVPFAYLSVPKDSDRCDPLIAWLRGRR